MEIIKKKCVACGKIIEGTSESQVEYNLTLHRQAHKRSDKKG